MKDIYRFNIILIGAVYVLLLFFITSCEQEEAVVELNTAPGGGTVSTYKAYSLDAVTEDDVYGRIVFYKDNSNYTLVQVSLYNTDSEADYITTLFSGSSEVENPAELLDLYTVDGETGEFSPSKFYVIKDKTFFDGLTEYDAHLKIMVAETLVSIGNLGKNATPVAEGD